jgi:hypothetical protein
MLQKTGKRYRTQQQHRKKKKANSKVQQVPSMYTAWTPEDGRLWPKHVARKHVYSYFIRILISFDELCHMRDCVIKKVIEKTCNRMPRYNIITDQLRHFIGGTQREWKSSCGRLHETGELQWVMNGSFAKNDELVFFSASVRCYLLLTLFLAHRLLSTWWWRWYVLPKLTFLEELHGVTSKRRLSS